MSTALSATDLKVRYEGTAKDAVCGVDLEVEAGRSVGVVGESGSGKTTLARALVGLIAPSAGRVLVGGRPWDQISRKDEARRQVQMVFQDPYGSLNPRFSARETVAEALRHWERTSRRTADASAERLLTEVGLARPYFDRRPGRLSGGQCQRVGIARSLAASPRVLVADEPTASLDVSVQAQILQLLNRLRDSHGLSLVFVSHDLAVVRAVSDHVLVMYAGRVVERGETAELFARPRHPYTRILLDAVPGAGGSWRMARRVIAGHEGCVFAARCPCVEDDCLLAQPRLESSGATEAACYHPLAEGTPSPKVG